ncbi:MAG: glycosyltransferase [Oscillibacter sp.]|jgi:glycosyltransferase involved in cell wall biosynthesis|nr:glycosyltransferase [Oscillibacter sp.]
MPEISVIVPVYNGEKCVEACVKSVQNQTFSDWELLLIDDGSKDSSGAVCDRLAAGDSRIRVFHKPNGGVSSARNLGLSSAAGDWIAFLDADDGYEPQCLQTLWDIRERAGADSAACAHLNLWPDGTVQPEPVLPAGVYDQAAIREKIVCPLLGDRLAQPVFNGFIWRYLYSAELLRQIGLTFEGAYLEDELFLMEYFCSARLLAVTEEPLYRYDYNPASATHRYMADFLKVFGRYMERKESLARRYELSALRPLWRENSNWAGILIAVGNEYAPGNAKTPAQRRAAIRALCARPEMAQAIAALTPGGLSRNKQIVARLVRGRHFAALDLLYRLKNRT